MLVGSMPCCAMAISDEAPQSSKTRWAPESIRMQAWKRPPAPNGPPVPRKRMFTRISAGEVQPGTFAAALLYSCHEAATPHHQSPLRHRDHQRPVVTHDSELRLDALRLAIAWQGH